MARGVKGSGGAAKTTATKGKRGKAAEPKVEKVTKAKAATPKAAKPKAEGNGTHTGVVDRSRYSYQTNRDIKTASGRASVDNGDPLAAALRGKSASDVIKLVADNGGTVNPAWKERNQGLARMAAGNVLRGLAKRPEGVKIDGKKLQIAA